jgi:hypothetical protein
MNENNRTLIIKKHAAGMYFYQITPGLKASGKIFFTK